MKIKYTGTAGVRIVEPYQWDASNGYVQDVTDPAILENLLTYPKPEFEAVEEPGQQVDESADQPRGDATVQPGQSTTRRRPASKRKE
jgi:hypothetical protein